jgi:hypothetical protein
MHGLQVQATTSAVRVTTPKRARVPGKLLALADEVIE